MKRIRSMIENHGNKKLYNDLKEAWGCWHAQDGSFDLRQRTNEFHMVSYVDFKTGKLKEGFSRIIQKPARGAISQIEAFKQCIISMMPKIEQVKEDQIWELFRNDRENLRTLSSSVDDESYIPDNMPVQWFDDVINWSSVLE